MFSAITLALFCWGVPLIGQSPSPSARETARIANVRSVSREAFLYTPRTSRIHDFDVYFSLRAGQESYCVDYETVVLDEIQDLVGAEGKDLSVSLNTRKNRVVVYTPQSRRLKARMVRASFCKSPAIVRAVFH